MTRGIRRALAVVGLLSMVAVLPAAAEQPGPNDGQTSSTSLKDTEFVAFDVEPLPNWLTVSGSNIGLTTRSLVGVVGDEFGVESEGVADTLSSFESYGLDDVGGEVLHAILADADDGASLQDAVEPDRMDAILIVDPGGGADYRLQIRGPQSDGFPLRLSHPLFRGHTPNGLAVVRNGDATCISCPAPRIVVSRSNGLGIFDFDGSAITGGTLVEDVFSDGLAGDAEGFTEPGDVMHMYQRPMWQVPAHQSGGFVNTAYRNTFALVGARRDAAGNLRNGVNVFVLRYSFSGIEVVGRSTDPTGVIPLDARIAYDYTEHGTGLVDAAVVYRGGLLSVPEVLHFPDMGDPVPLFDDSPGIACPLHEGRLPAIAVESIGWVRAVACAGIDSGGYIRSAVYREYTVPALSSTSPPNDPFSQSAYDVNSALADSGEELSRPSIQITFPCYDSLVHQPADSFTCNENAGNPGFRRDRWEGPSSVATHVIARTSTGVGGAVMSNRAWEPIRYSCTTGGGCAPDEPAAQIAADHRVLRRGFGDGPVITLPFSSQPYVVRMQAQQLQGVIREKGNPVPLAILVAPPLVAGAGQNFEESEFAQTHEGGHEGVVTTRHEAGAFVGVGVDVAGKGGFEVRANVEAALEGAVSASSSVEVTDFFKGAEDGDDHVVVYLTLSVLEWTGTVQSNSMGIGVGEGITIGVPTGQTIVSRNMRDFEAQFPDTWQHIGPSMLAAAHAEPGNPGSYLEGAGDDLAPINAFCIGDTDGNPDLSEAKPPKVFQNPFLPNPPTVDGPAVLVANPRLVLAGEESVVSGSTIGITNETARTRATEVGIGAEFEAKVALEPTGTAYATVGGHYQFSKGTGVTNSVSEGVSFTAGVGNVPNPDLLYEQYGWRMFLCKRNIETPAGPFPIWVQNFAVDGYIGSGGLEPLAEITQDFPVGSETTGIAPDFGWTHPSGMVKSYDLELEAVGIADVRRATVAEIADTNQQIPGTSPPQYLPDFDALRDRPATVSVAWEEAGLGADLLPSQLYRWRVLTEDLFGNPTATDWQFFVTEGPPTDLALVLSDASAEVGQVVTLTAEHSPVSGSVTYVFDLGDGRTVTQATPALDTSWSTTGTYLVEVDVETEYGTVSDDATLSVGPDANNDSYTVTEDHVLAVDAANGVLANDTGAFLAGLDSNPLYGTLDFDSDGSFVYTPNADSCRDDSFIYSAVGNGTSRSAFVSITVRCVDDPPAGPDLTYSTTEGEKLFVPAPGLLAQVDDPDDLNSRLEPFLAEPASFGVVNLYLSGPHADGSFLYGPDAGECGTDSFKYVVRNFTEDPFTPGGRRYTGSSDPITVTVEVACVNEPPVAGADGPLLVDEDASASIDVLANDTDPDSDPLTAVVTAQPSNGTATVGADQMVTYVPVADFCGPDAFTYVADDGLAQSGPVVVDVEVACFPDAPVAVDDPTIVVDEDGSTTADPLANDTDADGDTLTLVVTDEPDNGSLDIVLDGSVSYAPFADFCGTDSFTYQADDGSSRSNAVVVAIEVRCVNDAPVAGPDPAITLDEDTSATANLLGNDTDTEGDPLAVVVTVQPANGNVVDATGGSITYTPAADFCGADPFTYVADDGTDQSDPVVVDVEVACVNDAPVAVADVTITLDEDTTATATPLANDSDVDGDTLAVVVTDQPDHGALAVKADQSITYVPDLNFCGTDSLTYAANDGSLSSGPVVIVIDVHCVNDPPVVTNDPDDTETLPEDGSKDHETNVSDPEGGPFIYIVTVPPDNGEVTGEPDGPLTYTPDPDYCGTDSYTFVVSDGEDQSEPFTVNIEVECVPDEPVIDTENDPPAQGPEDTPITTDPTANDTDADGDELMVVITVPPADGTAVVNPDQTITYTPDANFCGTDSYTYVVTDGTFESDPVTVEVTVECVNDAPVPAPDSYSLDQDTTLVVPAPGVLANDTDVDGDTLTAEVATAPVHGSLVLAADGSFTYTPAAGYYGPDSFAYRVSDGNGGVDQAMVSLRVRGNTVLTAEPVVLKLQGLMTYIARFEATLTDAAGAPVAGKPVEFEVLGSVRCTAVTDVDGVARCSAAPGDWLLAVLAPYTASFAGDSHYNPSSGQAARIT